MPPRDSRRSAALERIADHMLRHGLAPSSLRALAETAGTSDRMLLYYFADKDEIVVEALRIIAARLAPLLAAALPPEPKHAPDALLGALVRLSRGSALRPFMTLWLELAALAARGEQPFLAAAGFIADGYLAWIADRLAMEDDQERATVAARLLATLDGVVLLDAVGRGAIGSQALEEIKADEKKAAPKRRQV